MPRRHHLSFEIPAPQGQDILEFWTHEKILGLEIGYDVQAEDAALDPSELPSDWFERYVQMYCPEKAATSVVEDTQEWVSRLQLKLRRFSLQFVPERMFSSGFHRGRAVTGKDGKALLMLEFIPDHRGMLFPADEDCEDIIPHELMHIKDVLDGRSPTMYPFALSEQGGWVDLFRHLWVDGYLEERGLPHMSKDTRVSQIAEEGKGFGKSFSRTELDDLADVWWGRPMTLEQAIRTGLSLGFPLEKDCPLERWYSRARQT